MKLMKLNEFVEKIKNKYIYAASDMITMFRIL